eukprot:scaffold2438_cov257-Pinguiococcus_pyrenoidosus.AAC.8
MEKLWKYRVLAQAMCLGCTLADGSRVLRLIQPVDGESVDGRIQSSTFVTPSACREGNRSIH